jgi:hypothetical protein
LTSARTLTDLLNHLPGADVADPPVALRDGVAQ